MKLEELEAFRNEEERLLTDELGSEEAQKSAQAAYEARLVNLDEEIREQLRLDIAKAREKRSGIPGRGGDMDEDGATLVCQESILVSFILLRCSISSHNGN